MDGQGVYLSSLLNWGWASAISRLLLNTALLQQEQSEKTELLPGHTHAGQLLGHVLPGHIEQALQAWPTNPRPGYRDEERGRG